MSNTTPSASPPPSESLVKQIKLLKIVSLILAVLLLGAVGFFLYTRHAGQPVTILVDGRPITTVRNTAAANQILADAIAEKAGSAFAQSSPVRLQKIQIQRIAFETALDPDGTAKQKLVSVLKIHVHAFVIVVDGHPSLGLPTTDAAAETLQQVKDHFVRMPPQAEVVGDPSFVENVEIRKLSVDTGQTRTSADEAASYFWTPPPSKTYVVKPGDVGVKIARHSHIAFADFLAANKDRDINKLQPGDIVNVQKMPMLISVRVKKRMTVDEKINIHAEGDAAGRRRLTYIVTYTNGEETRRDVQDIVTLQKPLTRMSL